jgi:hypothetical protein
MPVTLPDLRPKVAEAIKTFWTGRLNAQQAQVLTGRVDAGTRGAVTSGKHMDGFLSIALPLVDQFAPYAAKHTRGNELRLPGYYRHNKKFDVIVMDGPQLVAVLEFKSMVGSFGNNANNRFEEVLGAAADFWKAWEKGMLGTGMRPFLGWLMMLEDHERSRCIVTDRSPHFAIDPAFLHTSYIDRFNRICERMVQERLYTAAAVISSKKSELDHDGSYKEETAGTGVQRLFGDFASHLDEYTRGRHQPSLSLIFKDPPHAVAPRMPRLPK